MSVVSAPASVRNKTPSELDFEATPKTVKPSQDIISLQAKQAELSSLVINQQKISNLPVKEPPIFSGDYFEYPAFVTAFDSIICSNVPSNKDRLYFLEKYTTGKANQVVKGFLAMNSERAYERARNMLDHRFGNPVHVAEAYKTSLRRWPKIDDGDSRSLQNFSDFLVRCEEAMKAMQSMGDLDSTENLRLVSSKLPSYAAVKWCRHAHETQTKYKKIVKFGALVNFVREEAELANDPVSSPDSLKAERKKTGTQPKWGWRNKSKKNDDSSWSSNSFATSSTPPVSSPKQQADQSDQTCPLCIGRHALVKCVVAHSLAAGSTNVITNCRIIQVILFHKNNPEKTAKVYALLDDASDTTFVTTQVQHKLGINGVQTSLDLSTMFGRQRIAVKRIDGLVVERLDKRTEVELPKTYARQTIPSRRDQILRPETVTSWPHLKRIEGKIPPYDDDVAIGLLIACNCPRAIKPVEVIRGKGEEPYAVQTLLGWSIVGPVAASDTSKDGHALDSTCHRVMTREVISGPSDSANQLSFVFHGKTKEVINSLALNQMFELDFVEDKTRSKQSLSQEDRKFIEIAEKGIKHLKDGHYELPLPLKNATIELPNNKTAALRRLSQLKRRFEDQGGQKYSADYMEFLKKLIKNGYAEKVPKMSQSENTPRVQIKEKRNVWYIPHHGVYHPKKPNKIRVVFDCAAEFESE
ncbi:uncharacterized protein LOC111330383 [Stylophora pistillata]|uniref:uncharacterized protein LOC111330383 n=1 Tax=Stylophora pistillata TaxID=50429 RepID=UPI000C0446C6|nr:uncharacterized protein LOC111330383 [Stylophora pistillata]